MSSAFKVITFFLPWRLRRLALNSWFGYVIHPTAYIGFAWVFPKKLIMGPGSKIDHFTVAIHLDKIEMASNVLIGRTNWITSFPTHTNSLHFKHQPERRAELRMGDSSAITKNHHLDCTNIIEIGSFATIAGYSSQLLTHSINMVDNRQDSLPITIGQHTFVGTNVVVLGGSVLPSHCILGAKSLLNKSFSEEWSIYGGVPAKKVGDISKDAKYFSRVDGYVI